MNAFPALSFAESFVNIIFETRDTFFEKGRRKGCFYGFNGKEKIDEQYGIEGTAYDFGARLYDSRLGRWMAVDPLAGKYPHLSPYVFVANSPLVFIDPDGEQIIVGVVSDIDPADNSHEKIKNILIKFQMQPKSKSKSLFIILFICFGFNDILGQRYDELKKQALMSDYIVYDAYITNDTLRSKMSHHKVKNLHISWSDLNRHQYLSAYKNVRHLTIDFSLVNNTNLTFIKSMKKIEHVTLYGCELDSLPSVIYTLSNLKFLKVSNNKLTNLNADLCSLPKLEFLILGEVKEGYAKSNLLDSIPICLCQNKNLKYVHLGMNNFKRIPEVFFKSRSLMVMDIQLNPIDDIEYDYYVLAKKYRKRKITFDKMKGRTFKFLKEMYW